MPLRNLCILEERLGKLTAVNTLSCEAGEGFPVSKEE